MRRVEEPNATSSGNESRPRTPAYATFDSNTDKLSHILILITRGVKGYFDEWKTNLSPEFVSLGKTQDKEASNQENETDEYYKDRAQWEMDNLVKPVQQFTDGLTAIFHWIPVIMVTTVEAYLQDVLIYAAKVDPAMMESSKQSASYAQVRQAQSLEELTEELQYRWARNFVDDGGPDRWIKRLTKMGAREYRSQAAYEMETLWGVRHLIVHTAGVITPDFVRRHPKIGAKAGESILIRLDQIRRWNDVINHFVDVTDFYFVQRLGHRVES